MDLLQTQIKAENGSRIAPIPRFLLNEADSRASLGGISRSKLYDLVKCGELTPVKLGPGARSGIRFRPEDLADFAKRHLTEVAA